MELQRLFCLLKDKYLKIEKHDYLYLHDKEDYPIKNEMDFDNFYFVNEVSSNKVKVMGLLSGVEKEFDFSDLKGNWWILKIPESTRKQFKY